MLNIEKNYGKDIIFPSEWKIKSFLEVFKFFPTATYSRADLDDFSQTLYLHYGDIHTKFDFHLNLKNVDLPRLCDEKVRNYELLKEGDLVISDASEDYKGVGKSVEILNIGDLKVLPGLHTFLLRDKGGFFAAKYKGYVTLSSFVREQFYRLATGTKVYSISKTTLGSIKIPLPPLEEQKAIADCLSTWDKVIELQRDFISSKEVRKKAIVQQLLTGKRRLPGFTGEWKEVKLKDVTIKKSSAVQANLLESSSGKYSVFGASGFITNVNFFEQEDPYVSIVKDGSGVGNLFIMKAKSSVLGTLDVILPKNINLIFLYYSLKKINFTKYIVGGAIPHIYFKDYSKEEFNLPELIEQNAIAKVLETADKELQLEKQKLANLQQQKKALMQQLLTGKVRLM